MKNLYSTKLHPCKFLITLILVLNVFSGYAEDTKSDIQSLLKQESKNKEWVDEIAKKLKDLKDENVPGNVEDIKKTGEIILNISDSLKYKTGIIDATYYISYAFLEQEINDSVLAILNPFLSKFKPSPKNIKILPHLVLRGKAFLNISKLDSAISDFNAALDYYPTTSFEENVADIYMSRGTAYQITGDYEKAIEDRLEALNLYEKLGDEFRLAYTNQLIGSTFNNLKKFEKAIQYFNAAIKICENINNPKLLANTYVNTGICYYGMDSLELAETILNKAKQIYDQLDYNHGNAACIANLANIAYRKKEYKKTIELYKESLDIFKKIKNPRGIATSYLNLGSIYAETGKLVEAERYFKLSLDLAKSLNLFAYETHINKQLAVLYKIQGKYKEALENFEHYHSKNDSIKGEKQQNHILELEKKYQTEVKEREILALEKTSLNQKFIIAVLVAAALLLFFLYQWVRHQRCVIRRKQQLAQERNKHLEEKIELKNSEVLGLASQFVKVQDIMANTIEKVNHTIENNLGDKKTLSQKVGRMLKKSLQAPDLDSEFNKKLNEANEKYFNKLLNLYPELSPTELKVCALLRMNLSTKEISKVCNRSIRTIDFTRNSIRKRMNLQPNDNLTTHLITLN